MATDQYTQAQLDNAGELLATMIWEMGKVSWNICR